MENEDNYKMTNINFLKGKSINSIEIEEDKIIFEYEEHEKDFYASGEYRINYNNMSKLEEIINPLELIMKSPITYIDEYMTEENYSKFLFLKIKTEKGFCLFKRKIFY